MRRLYLVVAGLLGAAVAVLPGLAAGASPPSSASFTAQDPYSWQASGGGNTVTIAQGGTVTFSYPSGANTHNADFYTAAKPTSCVQTAGTSSGSVPPLPANPTGPGWTGTCTFNTPGTYTFYCDHHTFLMTGTVVVQGPGGTTTATNPPTTTATTGTTTPPPPPTTSTSTTPAAPPPGAATASVSVGRRQHGHRVAGKVEVPSAYAGGTLEVDVFASARSLGQHRHGLVRIGRLLRGSLQPGTTAFSVGIGSLHHHRSLTLTVHVLVKAPEGASSSSRFTVQFGR